ncbi:acyl carrier protein [Glaciimonas sp. PAMC28666]|uniref:acyl carrier protein n=1 Tax=Glaciimonas sp. PAMC28666 TaxID=2807626 RepID=UPI0019669298|nr:acyl carrier protein [Glaciimonas sp. PAMC28666]QRX82151.1 acyl carrier protein [Glaciimonas sp. PAMC28666]
MREQVKSYLVEYFFVGKELTDEVLLVDDLGADSLDLLQIVYTLNDMFGVEIKIDDLSRMLSVGGACNVVSELCQKKVRYYLTNEKGP